MDLIWETSGIDLFATDQRFRPVMEYVLRGVPLRAPLATEGAMIWLKRMSRVKCWAGLKKYHMYYRIMKKFGWERVFDGT